MIAFIIWLLCGVLFIGFGISAFRSEKAVGFWANAEAPEMKDVKAYNKAVGKLWCAAGGIFILLGVPILIAEQNSPLIMLSVVGAVIEMIVIMVVYSLNIEGKYRKN